MASLKRSYTKTTLLDLSAKIMDRLEETDLFQQASCIALYHPRRSADCRTDRKMVPEKEIIAPSYKRE